MNPSRSMTGLLTRRWLSCASNSRRLGADSPRKLWRSTIAGYQLHPTPTGYHHPCKQPMDNHMKTRYYSVDSSPSPFTVSDLDPQEFHQISDQTLDELTEALERLVESDHPEVTGWDVDYSSGVMNFSMGHHGTYVINKQPPNKQIWLSSPFSGPKRFDYDKSRKSWFYSREGNELMALLSSEIDSILGNQFFSQLLHSSSNLPQQ
ncbi:Mitochondrial chaperone Frataxin [Puccinia graminis f. sp. tritici]|uniref:ferroxidase n=1 Tax=Puccinia graminis f. sp. tritici TaxID=56615 RepID=A0A5B0QYS5_PUCGR|nr:Mitochondrial chaperone Frataxin [Puccinia graminis f. sp. tritici]KAA1118452.1 Mitochondrial chaperone Frataxin [Puccinia graminis f. sp. tritici]